MKQDTTLDFLTIHEVIKQARLNLSQFSWDYLMGAASTETTLKRNRMAFDSVALRPRVLRDVREVDASSELYGRKIRLPLFLAPIGSLESFAEGGGTSAAQAADEFGIGHMLSSVCEPGLEEVAAAANNLRMYQLYVRGDRDWVDQQVRRAIENGFSSFAITVDSAHYSRRERDIAKRFVKKWRRKVEGGMAYQASIDWDLIKYIQDNHDIPLILKGVATAEDAAIAVENNIAGIYISNHGGRQLDHGRGTLDVLPEVVKEVDGKAKVFIDGGISRGTDIVKAIVMGADAVGIGKLQGLGLGAAGVPGLIRVLEILEMEVEECLGLMGATSYADVDPSQLFPDAPIVTEPHVLSAYPLLNLEDEGY
jgi:isopentenyl diphosphate isomerase/L-lactate dehydrogenase-like FMN-dependent dehydrogenase